MAGMTIKGALAETLEDLTGQNLKKFCFRVLDRREERPVRMARLEGKTRLEVVDVLVSHYTERGALREAVDTLRDIDCNQEADDLESCMVNNGLDLR